MDPNETLAQIRTIAGLINDHAATIPADVLEAHAISLAEKIENLDLWITSQGFLPKAWAQEPF